jgi:hypothetical protein
MADDNDEEGDADGEGDTRRALSLPDQRPSPSSLESGIPSSPAAHDEPEDHMSRGRSAQGSCIRCSADKVKVSHPQLERISSDTYNRLSVSQAWI